MLRKALEPSVYPYFDYRRFTFSLAIEAADRIWLSGSTAVRFDAATKAMVVTGGLVAQAQVIFEKMQSVLAARALGLQHVTRLVQYLTPSAMNDLDKLRAAILEAFPQGPSVSTVVVKQLLRPEALIEIEAIAAPEPRAGLSHASACAALPEDALAHALRELPAQNAQPARSLVLMTSNVEPRTITALPPPAAQSIVVVPRLANQASGTQVELTGVSAGTPIVYAAATGDPARGVVVDQCREAYQQISRQLSERGSSLEQVVKTTEFITPAALADYRDTAALRRQIFQAPYPAATGVICERLPEVGSLIAVEAVAIASDLP